jgi:hypothetical protein
MFQSEFIGRSVDVLLEEGEAVTFDDEGFSNSLHFGRGDVTTISLCHDWVSGAELAELSDRHRLSAAVTSDVDPPQRVRARITRRTIL